MSSLHTKNMVQPVLIAGILFGVLTAIPPFNFINVCTCCSLFAASGFVAAWLYRRFSGDHLTPGNGAILGILTGVVGGAIHTAISLPIAMILEKIGNGRTDIADRLADILGDRNAEAAEMARRFLENSEGMGVLFIIIKLISDIFFFSIFALLGGILFAAIFKNRDIRSLPEDNLHAPTLPTAVTVPFPPPINIPPPIPDEPRPPSPTNDGSQPVEPPASPIEGVAAKDSAGEMKKEGDE